MRSHFCLILLLSSSIFMSQVDTLSAQTAPFDQVDPAIIRHFWLHEPEISFAAAPYKLTGIEREKFPGTFGVDLSHYSFDINTKGNCATPEHYNDPKCSCSGNWDVLTQNKILFAYSKATDGESLDLSFPRFWAELEGRQNANEIFRGAYHFLRPGIKAEDQANAFLQAIGATNGVKPDQLPPVLDIEWSNTRIYPNTPSFKACPSTRRATTDDGRYFCDAWYKMSSASIAKLASDWIDRVSQATGLPVIVYTNPSAWWDPVMGDDGLAIMQAQSVWTSRYTDAGPKYNRKWTQAGGSPKWHMPPLPKGASYPADKYHSMHFWQFSEATVLPQKLFTCSGKATTRKTDMNWTPVKASDYAGIFGVHSP